MKALIVSLGLDTNGQNFRYAEAAGRWGADPDVVRALIAGDYDPADVGGRFREAAAHIGGLSIRTAHVAEAYFDFPRDIRWSRRTHVEVKQLAEECDVIHLNNSDYAYRRLRMYRMRKPALLHHHGTLFRNTPAPLLAAARQFHMVQAVSTHDLQRIAPDELHWLPTAYDLDALAAIGEANVRPPDARVRVVSAPTNREIKSTPLLIAAVDRLKAEGLPIDLTLIEGMPWAECLRLKATADIYFDQVNLGYGCNAIEAWAMDIPVIAGADEWTLGRMLEDFGELPFYAATEATIADALRDLVTKATLRRKYAKLGKAHVGRFHAERPALRRLAELYGLAIARMAAAPGGDIHEFAYAPGVFRTTKHPRLMVAMGNQQYRFTDGELRIGDPLRAQKFRRLARARPKLAISEQEAV